MKRISINNVILYIPVSTGDVKLASALLRAVSWLGTDIALGCEKGVVLQLQAEVLLT